MITVYENIRQCLTMAGARAKEGRHPSDADLGLIENASVVVEEDTIHWIGKSSELPSQYATAQRISEKQNIWLPALVECHTHLVFGGERYRDYNLRCSGKSYADIAASGGGILSTVEHTRRASAQDLLASARKELAPFERSGVGCLEIKSGYGLTLESELRILECIAALQKTTPLKLIPTFLPAHAIPPEFKGRTDEYVSVICKEWIPHVATHKLAEFFDVFVEDGYFTVAQARKMAEAAKSHGLGLKLHVDQFTDQKGTALGVELGAASCDHLDNVSLEGIGEIARSRTVAVLAPGASLFTGTPYPPARSLIDRGAIVALTTDFNPGTCPSHNLALMTTLACSQMGMRLAEALVAVTYNAAQALRQADTFGTLEVGRRCNPWRLSVESYEALAYRFGELEH